MEDKSTRWNKGESNLRFKVLVRVANLEEEKTRVVNGVEKEVLEDSP